MNRARLIFHLDMNSFFASVEIAFDRTLKGKPVAIAGNPEERRGIIVTSSYEARAKGVKTTMPVWQAKKLCPNLIVLRPNGDRYRAASKALFEILFTYTPLVQQVSIDEGYLDMTSYLKEDDPIRLAKEMQKRVFDELHLPCSIGIAPNKFLAKMASDMQKPNGITVLRKREIEHKLWPLPIDDMHGIGKRTVDKWKKVHIHTIGDLAKADREQILKKFGERGLDLQERANGNDNRPVNPHAYSEYKSIGHSTTLRNDTRNTQMIRSTLEELAKRVQQRLRNKNVFARGVQITIRYSNWKMVTKSHKVVNPIQSHEELAKEAQLLFDKVWSGEAIRLLGISTYDLLEKKYAYKQLDLFTYEEDIKKEEINQTIQQLQEKFGEGVVRKGWKKHLED
ncbi:DNA polymerase IV [Alkalihalobacillus sp. MEB130]|uniref:DNA polymerase IV n=1 Tax=Alkalihalobacillus sp. MEB130 TaxID=2976704 RepID=UPI0028DFC7F3|nr:DNA polymerase IV [Alkalihalobacillus sp. MEB130]MDT8861687.1 DNA polymerase IV [Alkalihalobacillus sp. MEB130]